MSDQKDEKKTERRDFLFTATAAAGATGNPRGARLSHVNHDVAGTATVRPLWE